MPVTRTEKVETATTEPLSGTTRRQTTTAVEDSEPSGSVLVARLIYWLMGVVETLLAIRFVLVLFGANRGNWFAQLVFNLTEPLVRPFLGLFNQQAVYGSGHFEASTLVAMVVYALLAAGIIGLLSLRSRGNEV